MSRPDGRIEKGQRLTSAISARAWNRAQDAADMVLGVRPGTMAGESVPVEKASNIVLVRNGSGQVVPIFGVLTISGVVINPSGGFLEGNNAADSKAREFAVRPVLSGSMPSSGGRFAVALEPIPVNGLGRCAVGGLFPCKVKVNNASHEYATSLSNDVTQLTSTTCGAVKLVWKESGLGDDKWAVGVM